MEINASDIYSRIGQRIVDSIEDNNNWSKAQLHIEYIGGVKTNLFYFIEENKKNTSLSDSFKNMKDVKKLHEITTQNEKNKWNKAIFTLNNDFSFDIEFIWDQKLQDEVESYIEK